jgi:excisionase family DNA binding protein
MITTHEDSPSDIQADDRITVGVGEAVRLTGLGRSTLYQLMADGQIPYRTVGRRRLVLVGGLRSFVLGERDAA